MIDGPIDICRRWPKMSTKNEDEFNTNLGQRLALLRIKSKMSQQHLGNILGVRYQQIHKYETGENKLSPERIQACAKIFDVPVGYFYGEVLGQDDNKSFEGYAVFDTSEIDSLPEDIRKGFLFLSRQIKKTISKDKNEEQNRKIA
jgi:transcriptional regulator with XRE-family HTH domain